MPCAVFSHSALCNGVQAVLKQVLKQGITELPCCWRVGFRRHGAVCFQNECSLQLFCLCLRLPSLLVQRRSGVAAVAEMQTGNASSLRCSFEDTVVDLCAGNWAQTWQGRFTGSLSVTHSQLQSVFPDPAHHPADSYCAQVPHWQLSSGRCHSCCCCTICFKLIRAGVGSPARSFARYFCSRWTVVTECSQKDCRVG